MSDGGRGGWAGVLTGLRIRTRLWIIVAAAMVGIAAMGVLSARDARSSLQAERELKTRHLVEAASGVLTHFQKLEAAGTLTRTAAQSQAADVLRSMRYGEKGAEYFWINDARGRFVMHPTKPELQGVDKLDMTDPDGVPIMRRFIAASADGHAGFVAYSWPPASDPKGTPEPKTSYVQGFAPWGWTVGSGIYTSDVQAAFWSRLRTTGLWALAVLAVVAGLALLLGRGIVAQLREMRDAMTAIGTSGDLRARVPEGTDEIGQVGTAFNGMLASFGGVIRRVGDGARTLSATADGMGRTAAGNGAAVAEIAATIEAVSVAAGEQAASTMQATESVVGIAADVEHVASRGRGAAEAAQQADAAARDGLATLEEARRVMDQIDATVSAAADVVREVGARGAEVGQIVDVITDIAGQTNLLALNAAIEAARAGEHGRGFSVVAEEVRALAEQCATAADSIARIVTDMRSGTERAVQAIGVGRGAVDDGTATMRTVGAAFAAIREGVARVGTEVDGVAQAAETLERDAARIQDAMSTIAAISQENAAVTQQLAAPTESVELVHSTAGRVGELARDLDGLVTGFQVD